MGMPYCSYKRRPNIQHSAEKYIQSFPPTDSVKCKKSNHNASDGASAEWKRKSQRATTWKTKAKKK